MTELGMYCTKCGFKYDPNPSGSAPITCDCNAPFGGSVTFEPSDDGRVRTDWEITLEPDGTEREAGE